MGKTASRDDEAQLMLEAREEGRDNVLRQTAKTMIRDSSLDDATIAAYTGLPRSEVAKLRRGG